MSFSKRFAVVVAMCACTACQAEAGHRYECPSPLLIGGVKHALKHVDVYDGPPKDMASLQAWNALEGMDPYLVCRYESTDKVVTIHAVGSKSCNATDKPLAAYCD